MKQNVDVSCSEFRWTYGLYIHAVIVEKCMTFKDIFPVHSRTLSFNFQDFPGPKWFSRTFQVLEFSRKNPGLSRKVLGTLSQVFQPTCIAVFITTPPTSDNLRQRNWRTQQSVHATTHQNGKFINTNDIDRRSKNRNLKKCQVRLQYIAKTTTCTVHTYTRLNLYKFSLYDHYNTHIGLQTKHSGAYATGGGARGSCPQRLHDSPHLTIL